MVIDDLYRLVLRRITDLNFEERIVKGVVPHATAYE